MGRNIGVQTELIAVLPMQERLYLNVISFLSFCYFFIL